MSDDSGPPTKTKPKIFSMAQSQALLESKRLNTSHIQDQPRVVNDENSSAMLQRRTQLQAAPRISLTQFLSNPTPLRPSTPLTTSRPLTSSHSHNKRRRGPSSEKGKVSFFWSKKFTEVSINRYAFSSVRLVRLSGERIYSAKSTGIGRSESSQYFAVIFSTFSPSRITNGHEAFQRIC